MTRARMVFLFVLAALSCTLPSSVPSQADAGGPDATRGSADRKVQVIRLTVDPADEPVPALAYSLLPRSSERKPGNAVPYYYRAIRLFLSEDSDAKDRFEKQSDGWIKASLSELPREDIRKVLQVFEPVLAELRTAAYREKCEWDWRMQDLNGWDRIAFQIDEVQDLRRGPARLLAIKARLEIAERHYADAIETFQVAYQLARDVAKPPTLINNLTGSASARVLTDQVYELIAAPNSPNLYWALSELPRPFIDPQPALQLEKTLPERTFRVLDNPQKARRSSDEWRDLFIEAFRRALSLDAESAIDPNNTVQVQLAVVGTMMEAYPEAKRVLIAGGYTPDQVEKMPVGQVVAVYTARMTRFIYDELFKWSLLPYSDAVRGIADSDRKLRDEGYLVPPVDSREILPAASMLLPAVDAALAILARLDRRLAELRTIEAIRIHAAKNAGQLPKSLDEITVVPVPDDPIEDKPFHYRLDGTTAILESMPAPNNSQYEPGRRYEITIR